MSKKQQSSLTKKEKETLEQFRKQTEEMEMAQVMDLNINCNNPYQFAKTHSVYVKDWEKTKQQMIDKLESGDLPNDTRPEVLREMIKIGDEIIEEKLKHVREGFTLKFGKSIFDYIGNDGKTKGCLGVVLFFVITTSMAVVYLIV
jgi:hypothetical protein